MLNTVIIKKPIITERSMINAGLGWFTFVVDKKATKKQIAQETDRLFKVHVREVCTEIIKGKTKSVGRARKEIKTADWKKAFIRLSPGEKIELFETQHTEEKV